ncbi:MAG TPA: cytochrome c [Pyrinomonadaceae bacterium]|jgi:mono/diheme cytochrome c family protein
MKIIKTSFATAAILLYVFCAACDNTRTARDANTNARPASGATPAATPAAPAATPDELASAAADYSQFCINCHKADGAGGSVELEPGDKIEVESLREHGLKDSDADLAKQIREGGDDMPAFKGRLDEQRINNLVRYVRREFHGRNVSAPTAPAGSASATPARASH